MGCLDAGSTWTWLSARSGTGKDAETLSLVSRESLTPHAGGSAFQANVLRVCFLGWVTHAYRNVVSLTVLFSSLATRARVFIATRFVPWGLLARGLGFH